MASLRLALARFGAVVNRVPFDQGDLLKMIAEHAGSQQSGQATADNDRLLSLSIGYGIH
jgi:hypothetical protein